MFHNNLIIKEIIDESKNKSYEVLHENKKKIEAQIDIMEKEALEKIKLQKNIAIEEIKLEIVEKATSITENIIKNKLSKQSQHNIMQESVEQTKKIFN